MLVLKTQHGYLQVRLTKLNCIKLVEQSRHRALMSNAHALPNQSKFGPAKNVRFTRTKSFRRIDPGRSFFTFQWSSERCHGWGRRMKCCPPTICPPSRFSRPTFPALFSSKQIPATAQSSASVQLTKKSFFATSPIRRLISAYMCFASHSHRWSG